MRYSLGLAALAATASAAETVIGVYIFSRHGDRTSKSTPPANLTDLGYEEVFTSGTWFRNRYIASGATNPIYGMNTDLVLESQLTVSAPVDNVLQNSAMGFTQALYPPVGSTLGSATLRNGTIVHSPLNGYQLIPIEVISTGANSENDAWLQGSTNCANAEISSNNYFLSSSYNTTATNTKSFYSGIYPMVSTTFEKNQTTFHNAYLLFDYLNVASIHNATNDFPNADLLTNETFYQLRTLADQHEFGLAYNASDPIRAVTGSIIAAQVLTALNGTITSKGSNKLNVQFGAYGGMMSFFGQAGLIRESIDFYGVPDYASTLTWELVTNATVSETSFPTADEISVRFLFHNGTTSDLSVPTEYPLFGSGKSPLPWNEFVSGMNAFAIGSQADWCKACGNSTGVCSAASLGDASGGSSNSSSGGLGGGESSSSSCGGGGMSRAVAGVIGAMVTLAVILGVEALILLLAGLRLVSKKKLAGTGAAPGNGRVKA
jgi:hypothetical protein